MLFFRKNKKVAIATTSPARPDVVPSGVSRADQAVPLKKSEEALWLEAINPLRGLTAAEAGQTFDAARSGNYSRIQYIYSEIERTDPTLLISTSRRAAALSELDWEVVRNDARLNRGDFGSLADEQIECLETAIAKADNLAEAIEHLGLAPFRGFSHVSPIFALDGLTVERFELPDTWNFCQNRMSGEWLWNPDATLGDPSSSAFEPIPASELVTVQSRTAVDWPALEIFLRLTVGERSWGQFLEMYGLPPVVVTMPDGTTDGEESLYAEAARSIYEARNGAIPFGSTVSYATDARGTDPFSVFLDHQQKLIVLMATGGLLTSLAEAGSGTLAGSAHEETWRQIVRRDARISSSAINKQLCEGIIRRAFPGRPILAEFRLDTEPRPSASEILDLAGKARAAGLKMDVEELSSGTGYTLTEDPAASMPAAAPMMMEARPTPAVVQNADDAPAPDVRHDLASAIRADHASLADRLEDLLALPEDKQAEAAAALLDELDELAGGDDALADTIAAAIADGFRGGL